MSQILEVINGAEVYAQRVQAVTLVRLIEAAHEFSIFVSAVKEPMPELRSALQTSREFLARLDRQLGIGR